MLLCCSAVLFDFCVLFGAGAARRNLKHLATTIRATVRAGMVRAAGLAALRADGQLGNLHFVMRAAVGLARIRETAFW